MPSTEQKIIKQVEFYFSDSNLPKDKFLKGITDENDGWVPIKTLASFKRLQSFTKDESVVVAALKNSEGKFYTKLQVNEEGDKVKRVEPLPEAVNLDARAIYVKGLPKEMTLESLEDKFSKLGNVKCVRMRRTGTDREFTGACFVEFATEEEAVKAAAEKFEDGVIVRKKSDWLAEKALKKGAEGGDDKKRKAQGAPPAVEPEPIVKDLIVHFNGLPDTSSREDLKKALEDIGCKVAYVDFSRGETEAWVRLDETNDIKAAEASKTLNENKTQIMEKEPELMEALSGEAEESYWTKVRERMTARKNDRANKKGGRRSKRVKV